MTLGAHDQAEEGLLLLLPVDLHPTPKEPMTAVLARGGRAAGQRSQSVKKPNGWNMLFVENRNLLDWARSKHSTLVGFLLILWNIDV